MLQGSPLGKAFLIRCNPSQMVFPHGFEHGAALVFKGVPRAEYHWEQQGNRREHNRHNGQ
jgi:hypothetical protein